MRVFYVFILLIFQLNLYSQDSSRVLFIGNSYTYYNNLPQLLTDMAASTGDFVQTASSTPGGYTFQLHSTNATTLQLIQQGNWDFVILQEQSQRPSFPDNDVQVNVFPYASVLDSLIGLHNPCAETVFYNTWGRQNGDANNCAVWPPVCTYQGMDSMLQLRYRYMADANQALLAPVAQAWRYVRSNWPWINLYDADGSHPSLQGSYLASAVFYTVILRKDPRFITYNGGLPGSFADSLKNLAGSIVYDSLSVWNVGNFDPVAQFNYQVNPSTQEVTFQQSSQNADQYIWYFGNGDSSLVNSPNYTFLQSGNYTVTLIASSCGKSDTVQQQIQISLPTNVNHSETGVFRMYPNPTQGILEFSQEIEGFSMWNHLGQVLLSDNEKTKRKDLSQIEPGIYIIEMKLDSGKLIRDLIKIE
jgi:hypothetical protein